VTERTRLPEAREPHELDDPARLRHLDVGDMLGFTAGYAGQVRRAWPRALAFGRGLEAGARPAAVLILGTGGGSAAAAHLLSAYLFDRCPVPLVVYQGYDVPAFTGPDTLVLAVTHSGNTEETLTAAAEALGRGARVVALTAGGRMAAWAASSGLDCLALPGGMMPRVIMPELLASLLGLLAGLGLVDEATHAAEVAEAASALEEGARRWGPTQPASVNQAKDLAAAVQGFVPLIYGTLPFTVAVARRWQGQFAENAKVLAHANAVPQLHHDEVAGWDAPPSYLRRFYGILLSDREDGPAGSRRLGISARLLAPRLGGLTTVSGLGEGRLARLLTLAQLGDYVTAYLALLGGSDPTPVPVIAELKRLMGQEENGQEDRG